MSGKNEWKLLKILLRFIFLLSCFNGFKIYLAAN